MAKVLVVDDNAINRKLIITLLQYEGHTTFEATDGMQGLTLARAERPHLIISDILMPTMDGYEFVRQLRADSQLASTAVIFHTAHYHDREAQKLAQSCQVEHVLAKPCDTAELLRVVALALSGAPAAPSLEATGEFDRDHRRLITNKLLQKVEELQQEIEERRQAEAKVHQLNRVYAVLSGINSLIVRVASRDELCTEACRLAVEHGRFRVAWIGMLDSVAAVVTPFAWAGESQDLRLLASVPIGGPPEEDGLIARAIRSRQPVVCNDLKDETQHVLHRQRLLERGYRSIVSLPLVIADKAIGCLTLVAEEPGFFDDAEMRLLVELAGDISFAFDHIQKAEQLDYLAYYDSLTGLANRTLFQERLAQYLTAAGRHDSGLAVVITDLERFEQINDTLGRHVGDTLLRQVAERFARCVA